MRKGFSKIESSALTEFLDAEYVDSSKPQWEKEWDGMPEFNQGTIEPYAKIVIRFECAEDLADFSKLVGQHLNHKTKSMWHPKIPSGLNSNKRYRDIAQS